MKPPRQTLLLIGLLTSGLLLSGPALAVLGGDSASVEADRVSMKGQVRPATSASGYEVREINLPGGTQVREYLSPAGKVFALSWRGPALPDLRQMLGTYYPRYAAGAKAAARPGSHRHMKVEEPNLVVESNGRMRAFYGRAWDPALLPPNFSVSEIR
ncbi:MAG TPA: DUF2844 domain-containing protein [Steroidobacteraceae bacterium]|nr:DUF2844 domain-containing protein [Steroidobacteraceae bacterium]